MLELERFFASILAVMNVPCMASRNRKKVERRDGSAIENLAKETCDVIFKRIRKNKVHVHNKMIKYSDFTSTFTLTFLVFFPRCFVFNNTYVKLLTQNHIFIVIACLCHMMLVGKTVEIEKTTIACQVCKCIVFL